MRYEATCVAKRSLAGKASPTSPKGTRGIASIVATQGPELLGTNLVNEVRLRAVRKVSEGSKEASNA